MLIDDSNVARELRKIRDVLVAADEHLAAKDAMNAALHMAKEVRATPLAVAVHGARLDIEQLEATLSGN